MDRSGFWDFFNLGAVAKKLIGKDVKRYRDIVDDGQTLQDIPFKDLVEHGCADADATFKLYSCLRTVLKEKGIDSQFANDVMPLMRLLGDKELDGVRVDVGSVVRTKDVLVRKAERAKSLIVAKAERQFDVDSIRDIDTIFRDVEGLRERIGRQPLRQGQLEQFAQGNEIARAVVQYRRLQKQVSQLEAIWKAEKNGKVFPLFSQMKAAHGSISSVDPNLLLDGLSHTDVLISLAVGVSTAALCRRFLINAGKASDLRKNVTGRYPQLFAWLDEYRRNTASSGFASSGGRRRYWDGLRSSDIDKRNRAQRSAVRWLIGM